MKKWNNKGFSLVELIIVIAIMAVLMAVLAPFMINYVERSRVQKDESALDEVLNSTHIALSVDEVYNNALSTGVVVTINDNSVVTANSDPLRQELQKICPEPIEFQSKKYMNRGGETIGITFSNPHGTFILDPSWVEEENN